MKRFKDCLAAKILIMVLIVCMSLGSPNIIGAETEETEISTVGETPAEPEEEKKVLEEDELLETDIEQTGDSDITYTDEETEELEISEEVELTAEVNGVEIKVTGSADAFGGEGELSLEAEEITDERLEQAKETIQEKLLTAEEEFTAYRLFDITPLLDGEEIQPQKPVSVSFKNLELENVTSDETNPKAKNTESEETLGAYHFLDEKTVEEMIPVIQEDVVTVEVEHFSWYFWGNEHDITGDVADWTYEDEGGEYTLEYILSNYNVFVKEDYFGSHVVGPVVIGGDSLMSGSFGGVSDHTVIQSYPHQVPSYWKGKGRRKPNADMDEIFDDFPGIKTDNPDMPAYFGWINKDYEGNSEYNPDYTPLYYTDAYVDFNKAFGDSDTELPTGANSLIASDAASYLEYEGYDTNGHHVTKVEITDAQIQSVKNGGEPITDDDSYRIYKEGGEVYVSLRPGHNFQFESFQDVDRFIYDYESIEELISTFTVISTEQRGVIQFPKIFKSVANDELGPNGQFGSIEVGPEFTVLYLMPNAERIYVGCSPGAAEGQNPDYAFNDKKETPLSKNGSKLVGHLVAPFSEVVLRGGDYNGCVIAKKLDATGTEGHMWPFKKNTFMGDLKVSLLKTVNGEIPGEGNIFSFTAELRKKGSDKIIKSLMSANNEKGVISFLFNKLDVGEYTIRVYENNLTDEQEEDFNKSPVIYEAEVTMSQDSDGNLIPSVTWYKIDGDTRTKVDSPKTDLVFDNTTKRQLIVKKAWQDEIGNLIDGEDEVTVKLYQTTELEEGHKVTFNIYYKELSGDPSENGAVRIGEITKYVKDGGDVDFNIEFTENASGFNYRSAGIHLIKKDKTDDVTNQYRGNVTSALATYFANALGTLENINAPITMDIYYMGMQDGYKTDDVTMKMFDCAVTSDDWAEPKFNESALPYDTFTLTSAGPSPWIHTFANLPEYDTSTTPPTPYYYKVVEELPGGYEVTYDENQINTGDAETTITNQKIPCADLKLVKKDSMVTDADSGFLAGAEFTLKGGETTLWFMESPEGIYQYLEKEQTGATQKLVTGADGAWKITGLPYGTYELEEIKAPDGYDKETRKVTIVISEESGTYQYAGDDSGQALTKENGVYWFTFENTPGVELPETGGIGTDWFTKAGLFFMEMSLMIACYEIARRRKEEKTGIINKK